MPQPPVREDLFRSSPFGRHMGTRVLRADPTLREIEVEYLAQEAFTNRMGNVAGGMISSFLDSVTGLAALTALPEGKVAVHTSLHVAFHRPLPAGPVRARGRVVSVEGRDVRTRGELVDAAGAPFASAEATLRVVRDRRD